MSKLNDFLTAQMESNGDDIVLMDEYHDDEEVKTTVDDYLLSLISKSQEIPGCTTQIVCHAIFSSGFEMGYRYRETKQMEADHNG